MIRSCFTLAVTLFVTILFGVPSILFSIIVPRSNTVIVFGRLWSRVILTVAGVKVTTTGSEKIDPRRTYIFLGNHQSNLDVLALLASLPMSVRIVAKKYLFYIPIFGWAIYLMGMIPIDRGHRTRAIKSLERAAERIRAGASVFFFAEGTRSPDGSLLPFKKGAFVIATQAGVPIVPVVVNGTARLLPKRSILIRPGVVTVHYGDPIPTAGYTKERKEELMSVVRAAMLEAMGQTEKNPPSPGAAVAPLRASSSASRVS